MSLKSPIGFRPEPSPAPRYMIHTDVFTNPEKYVIRVPLDKVVSDSKVHADIVCKYGRRITNGEKLEPIVVIKHPKKDLYAVVDGHHRYHALRLSGKKEIDVALEGVLPGMIFFLTKNGFFQPRVVKNGHARVSYRLSRYFMKLFFRQEIDTLPFTEAEKSSICEL